jgi:hypothetical protein
MSTTVKTVDCRTSHMPLFRAPVDERLREAFIQALSISQSKVAARVGARERVTAMGDDYRA